MKSVFNNAAYNIFQYVVWSLVVIALLPDKNRTMIITILVLTGLLYLRGIKTSYQITSAGKYRVGALVLAVAVLWVWFFVKGRSFYELPWSAAALTGLIITFGLASKFDAPKNVKDTL